MTYTIQTVEYNAITNAGSRDGIWRHPVTWNCGHRHRTLTGAVRCLRTLAGTARSINAGIYNEDGDVVDEYRIWDAEREIDNR